MTLSFSLQAVTDPVTDESPVPSLQVNDLTVVTDGGSVVVDQVSFDVAAGEVLGLVGESGSGKTTIALALLGHTRRGLKFSGGTVLLSGRDVLSLPADELRRVRGRQIAYVPQDPSSALNPAMRVGAQVEEALLVHGFSADEAKERAVEVLGEVGIAADRTELRKYPHQMSGGQQQRVALAMAFACRPRVIVLDEPTTGLDVSIQRQVLETMARLCSTYGVAAVYVSHDLAVVNGIATRVAVAYAGRVVELGTPDQVFRAPVHPYTAGLVSSIPSPDQSEVLVGIPGQPPHVGARTAGCAFQPRCGRATEACAEGQPEAVVVDGRMVRCFNVGASAPASARPRILPAAAETVSPRLVVRDLHGYYGEHEVLHGIDVDIAPRECLAVVGESGAGKTTLAQCIAGLNGSWSGSISLDGVELEPNVRGRDRDLLRRVQYVFQNPYLALNPRKTIRQIVREPFQHFFSPTKAELDLEVERVLHDVAVPPAYLDRYPDQLSGGQRQRVAIARAVIVRPEVLICDEITSALDVSVQAVIIEMLRQLQADHDLSLVFITHNLPLVRSVAQRAVVLSRGRIVEQGTVEQILANPTDPYTVRLIGDMPKLATTPSRAEGDA